VCLLRSAAHRQNLPIAEAQKLPMTAHDRRPAAAGP